MATEHDSTKTCSKCGETKHLSEFHRNSARADGLQKMCKACVKANASAWYLANRDRVAANSSAWKEANRERVNSASTARRSKNPEKHRAAVAKWRKNNPETAKKKLYEWRANNKAKLRINQHNYMARKVGELSSGLADKLVRLQRGKCACCGLPLGDDYHLDHIMPLALGGTNTDDNIQLLRSTCNLQKHAKHPVDFMRQRGYLL